MNSRPQKYVFLLFLLPGLALASNLDTGKALYDTCVACHGANGEGNAELLAPGLAGQSESYLTRQIWDFKNRRRGAAPDDTAGAQMLAMADTLKDGSAVTNVATYLASLPANEPPATISGNVENGQK